jgi:predicted metal-dependent hydrolase
VDEQPLPPEATVAEATRLLEEGRPFAAHEVFEARWKEGPDTERDLWQGLAQLCVGITHARRGNRVGAATLVERGAAHVHEYAAAGGPTYGLDLAAWVGRARAELTPA